MERMKRDRDTWDDRLESLDNAARSVEVSLIIVVAAGLAVGGIAVILDLPFLPAVAVGALLAASALALHWARSKRRGSTYLIDE